MDKQEFRSFCHEEFVRRGFKKYRSTYYIYSNCGLLCALWLQSSYGSGYYINCDFFIGYFPDSKTYPSRYDYDLSDRPICVMSKTIYRGKSFMTPLIEYEKYSADELHQYFNKAFTEQIMPPIYLGKEELIKKLDVWNFPDPTIKSEEEILKKLMQGLE